MRMANQYLEGPIDTSDLKPMSVAQWMDTFEINNAMAAKWADISVLDHEIQREKPFELIKTNPIRARKLVTHLAQEIFRISKNLEIFMPETAQKIQQAIRENIKPENLFPRKE